MVRILCKNTKRFSRYFILFWFAGLVFCEQKSSLSVKSVDVNKKSDNEIKNLSIELDRISLEIEELKKRLNNNTTEIKETGSSIVELNRKIERLNNDIINLMSRVETLSKDVSDLKIERFSLESKSSVQDISEQTSLLPKSQLTENKIEGNFSIKHLTQEIDNLKKELKELKENQNISTPTEIKNPNLRRMLTSPYLVVTSILISILALIATF